MIITTSDQVEGKTITKTIGLVRGSTIRAKHLGKDIMAGLKTIVGGELQEYTEMLTDARVEAMNRMINDAQKLGAEAIINVRFTTTQTMAGAAELLAYGTAVRLIKSD